MNGTNSRQMQEHEARMLLNLKDVKHLDAMRIEQAYKAAISVWSRKIVDPLVGHEERDRANDMLKLLMQAKALLATSATISTGSRAASAPVSAGTYRSPIPAPFCSLRPSGASTKKVFCHVGMIFTHVVNTFSELFKFVLSVPGMCVEIKEFVCSVLDDLARVGIPKVAGILAMILLLLPVISLCGNVVKKLCHLFGK